MSVRIDHTPRFVHRFADVKETSLYGPTVKTLLLALANGWYLLLLEPLHGLTYAAAAVAYVAERTPAELEATGQAALDVVQAMACAVGTAVGGVVMQHFGSRALYRGSAVVVLSATVAFSVGGGLRMGIGESNARVGDYLEGEGTCEEG